MTLNTENDPIFMFSGKGGVGKTTCAGATALHFADANEKTLAVSTDPTPSLSHIFEAREKIKPVKVRVRQVAGGTLILISMECMYGVIPLQQRGEFPRREGRAKGLAVQPAANHGWKGYDRATLVQTKRLGSEVQSSSMQQQKRTVFPRRPAASVSNAQLDRTPFSIGLYPVKGIV